MPAGPPVDRAARCPERISIVGTLPPLRAISSYCDGMATALADLSEVEFFSFRAMYPGFLYPGDAQEDSAAPAPRRAGLHIDRRLAWYNPLSWASVGLRLSGQVLNLHWWSLPLAPILIVIAALARLRRVPVVTTVHNVEPHNGGSLAFRLASRLLFALSDRLIVHSHDNAGHLARLYPSSDGKTIVSRMGVADFRRGRPVDRAAARTRLALPQDRSVLLMFGAVRDYKGIPDALTAMASVTGAAPDTLLLVAGSGWHDEQRYREMVDRLGLAAHVRLDLRYIPEPEVHDYFAAADMLLLPYTQFSAQSGAGISALGYGLPLVVSRCGSLPELVVDPASVVAPGDPTALAQRIARILRDPALYARLADDSRSLSGAHSWPEICARLCAEFSALTDAEPRPAP